MNSPETTPNDENREVRKESKTGRVTMRRRKRERKEPTKAEKLQATLQLKRDEYIQKYGDLNVEYERSRTERYSGRQFEQQVLGAPDIVSITRIALEKGYAKERRFSNGEMSFPLLRGKSEEVFGLVKQHQGENDPTNPSKMLPHALRESILERIGVTDDQSERVQYYTTVGTPLDYSRGTDAFFEIQDESGERISLSLDVTTTSRDDKIDLKEKGLRRREADLFITEHSVWALHDLALQDARKKKESGKSLNEHETLVDEIFGLQVESIVDDIVVLLDERKKAEVA